MKRTNISVFIPHSGCPHACSFCNQRKISGQTKPVTVEQLRGILTSQQPHLMQIDTKAEIAFFGGSFTAIDREYMTELLQTASEFVKEYPGQFCGIRCSTRPDCIDDEVLDILKRYGMTAIELGAQSMNDNVLIANNRGHTADDVRTASRLIRSYGFELGLQMMTGLYKDDEQSCINTAKEFIALQCDTVRIYPTVILKDTALYDLYMSGEYKTFDFDKTVDLCAVLLQMFGEAGIPVIRLGLHASKDVEQGMAGGVYHPALRELVESRIILNRILNECTSGKYIFYTDKRNISRIIGNGGCNRERLLQSGISFKIKQENGTDFRAERIG